MPPRETREDTRLVGGTSVRSRFSSVTAAAVRGTRVGLTILRARAGKIPDRSVQIDFGPLNARYFFPTLAEEQPKTAPHPLHALAAAQGLTTVPVN